MDGVKTDVDLNDPSFVADPYPVLAELRATGPVLWHEPIQRWLATTHDAVSQTLRNRRLGRIWTDWEPVADMEPFNALHRNQMMENEPPVHTRLRRLVAGAFGRGHVERMRPRVEALTAGLLDGLSGTADILGDYAEPLPVYVICDLLGVPGDDHAQLRTWSQGIVHMYEQGVGEETKREAIAASVAFSDYVAALVAERKAQMARGIRGDDLLTDLIAERDTESGGAARLSEDELVATVVLLLNAGHEASVNVFGNGLYALLSHPVQRDRVLSGEVSIATALEELIRYDAPLQLFERTATEDVEIAGTTVRTGDKVACLMGSANRDGAVFADADAFVVSRDPNPHVGFGMGLHFCLGAPLARMELEISLSRLLERFPRLALTGVAPRRPTWVLRGFEGVEVDLGETA
ncbi:cytochrome P450 [Mumia zhuanghuii]|uniref:Cytochrome P450 n=1 Tax=Mumia zhuanghuii TaxID=2585211 RepID=A0A5C4MPC4_9ACTN|nr:cytochrome P450 [Mumia zhuanghuii]TNC44994.1 cytochrome P450 [Mumia zhuanghuii]